MSVRPSTICEGFTFYNTNMKNFVSVILFCLVYLSWRILEYSPSVAIWLAWFVGYSKDLFDNKENKL